MISGDFHGDFHGDFKIAMGKSPVLIGKSTIKWLFSIANCNKLPEGSRGYIDHHLVPWIWFEEILTYWCVLRREFSGMIHFITSHNHPSNPHSCPFPTFSTSKI